MILGLQPGKKLDHSNARIPDPSGQLWDDMTIHMYQTFGDYLATTMDVPLKSAGELDPVIREAWQHSARAAYTVIAIYGGGCLEKIKHFEN